MCHCWGRAGAETTGPRRRTANPFLTQDSWELQARKQLLTLSDLSMSYLLLLLHCIWKMAVQSAGVCLVECQLGIYGLRGDWLPFTVRTPFGFMGNIFIRFWPGCLRERVIRGLFLRDCQEWWWKQSLCWALHWYETWSVLYISSTWEGEQLSPFCRWGNSPREGKCAVQIR